MFQANTLLTINRVEASSDPLKSKSFIIFSVSKVFLEKVSRNFPDGIICWWKEVKKKRELNYPSAVLATIVREQTKPNYQTRQIFV